MLVAWSSILLPITAKCCVCLSKNSNQEKDIHRGFLDWHSVHIRFHLFAFSRSRNINGCISVIVYNIQYFHVRELYGIFLRGEWSITCILFFISCGEYYYIHFIQLIIKCGKDNKMNQCHTLISRLNRQWKNSFPI